MIRTARDAKRISIIGQDQTELLSLPNDIAIIFENERFAATFTNGSRHSSLSETFHAASSFHFGAFFGRDAAGVCIPLGCVVDSGLRFES
jgi:hypothetical protein